MNYRNKSNELVSNNYLKNKWIESQSADFYFQGLKDEIDEVEEEIETGNKELIEFELVDIFWTTLNLIERLHKDGKINKNGLYEKAYKKYAERLPNIAAGEDIITKEKQDRLWNEAKKRQKKELGIN